MLKIKKKKPYRTMAYWFLKNKTCNFLKSWYNSCILTKQREKKNEYKF